MFIRSILYARLHPSNLSTHSEQRRQRAMAKLGQPVQGHLKRLQLRQSSSNRPNSRLFSRKHGLSSLIARRFFIIFFLQMFCLRAQFLAIEIARNREGHNQKIVDDSKKAAAGSSGGCCSKC